jgi:hypothetical protein
MESRFQLIEGRHNSLPTTRLYTYTYGENKLPEQPNHNQETDDGEEHHGTYGALLFDKRWREKRLEILQRDNNQCVICAASEPLQVHHRQYHMIKTTRKFKPPWEYTDDLLITLCENCHSRGHNKFRVPVIQI